VLVEPGDFRTQITAKRCVATASQNSAYRTAFDKFKRKQDQDEAAAPTPEPVARLVERILSHRRPKARYTVAAEHVGSAEIDAQTQKEVWVRNLVTDDL
jgi:hypothetical protein